MPHTENFQHFTIPKHKIHRPGNMNYEVMKMYYHIDIANISATIARTRNNDKTPTQKKDSVSYAIGSILESITCQLGKYRMDDAFNSTESVMDLVTAVIGMDKNRINFDILADNPKETFEILMLIIQDKNIDMRIQFFEITHTHHMLIIQIKELLYRAIFSRHQYGSYF